MMMMMMNPKKRTRDEMEEPQWKQAVRAQHGLYMLSMAPTNEIWFVSSACLTKDDIVAMAKHMKGRDDLIFTAKKEGTKHIMAIQCVSEDHEFVQRSKRYRNEFTKVQTTEQYNKLKAELGLSCGTELVTSFASLMTKPTAHNKGARTSMTCTVGEGILLSEVVDFDKRTRQKQAFDVYIFPGESHLTIISDL
jgi:hypothetical protein